MSEVMCNVVNVIMLLTWHVRLVFKGYSANYFIWHLWFYEFGFLIISLPVRALVENSFPENKEDSYNMWKWLLNSISPSLVVSQ